MSYPAYQYVADDGVTYQVSQSIAFSSPTAGNLVAALGSEPLFPGSYAPRHIRAINASGFDGLEYLVICNASNSVYESGPGTSFSCGSKTLRSTGSIGEARSFIFI